MQRHATCPCQPGFSTQLLGKRRRDRRGMNDYERFTFCQHCKKDRLQIALSPFPYKKDGLLLKDNWENRREMAEQQVLTKWCLFWGSGSKHASKTHTQKKVEIKHPGKIYVLPTKCGCCKELVGAQSPPILCGEMFTCTHSFCRLFASPAVYSYKKRGWPLGVNFKGGIDHRCSRPVVPHKAVAEVSKIGNL